MGSVCFGWAVNEGDVRTTTYQFDGDREAVRLQAVKVALLGVVDIVKAN